MWGEPSSEQCVLQFQVRASFFSLLWAVCATVPSHRQFSLPSDRGRAWKCWTKPPSPGRAHQPGQLSESLHQRGGAGGGWDVLLLQVQDPLSSHQKTGSLETSPYFGMILCRFSPQQQTQSMLFPNLTCLALNQMICFVHTLTWGTDWVCFVQANTANLKSFWMFLAAALQEMVVVCAQCQLLWHSSCSDGDTVSSLVVEHLQFLFFSLFKTDSADHWSNLCHQFYISFIFYQLDPKIEIVTQGIIFTSIG